MEQGGTVSLGVERKLYGDLIMRRQKMIESIGKAFYFGVVFAIVVFGMVLSGGAGLILAIKTLELIFY